MSPPSRILLLTMPGFGVETLKRLHQLDADWRRDRPDVVLIERAPNPLRRAAAGLRFALRRSAHRHARLADHTLAAADAQRWLRAEGYRLGWSASDAEVRALRAARTPALTLTITSRVIFGEATLACCPGEWWNVHPGLLPQYAGASPVPYMFADGRAGCTIHRMVARVDAGPVLDIAELEGDLGADGGELLYERLPVLAAARLGDLLQRWRRHVPLPAVDPQPGPLQHRSAARLTHDRVLDWRRDAAALSRWTRALMPFAPATLIDAAGRRVAVCEAMPVAAAAGPAPPGTVLQTDGHRLTVATADGALALRCGRRPRAAVGCVLPAVEAAR